MKENELINSMQPGEYSFDNSAHKYKRVLKGHSYTTIGHEWHALSSKSLLYHGIAKKKEEAEAKAKHYSLL